MAIRSTSWETRARRQNLTAGIILDSSSIELPGSEIGALYHQGDDVRIHFSRAIIIKTMTGSVERTRWWQAGDLVIGEAEPAGPLPQGPLVCVGGDVEENLYTYRDMIPIPLASRGRCRCVLRFRGVANECIVAGSSIALELEDVPKYIEHIRPSS